MYQPILPIFRRHYHKTRSAQNDLAESGEFHLQIKSDGYTISGQSHVPDQEKTMRFVVLMRRFLAPTDRLYYQRIWELLQEPCQKFLPRLVSEQIDYSIANLRKGILGINVNGEDLTAERIYQLIADGTYFDEEEGAARVLRGLVEVPLAGPLFLHQFYAYSVDGFWLISQLFGVVCELEKRGAFGDNASELACAEYRCIYCLRSEADFTSEEHVLPESLGNEDLILPNGYVCDNCNNGILSDLDNSLVNFGPIAFLRVQFLPYTKQGKFPRANFQNVIFERTSPRHINIKAKDKTGMPRDREVLGNGWYRFNLPFTSRGFNPQLLARSLYKVALGTLALGEGHDTACSTRYQGAREFVLGDIGFPNNLLMREQIRPQNRVQVSYRVLETGTPFGIDIAGLTFLLNLEASPLMEVNDTLKAAHFVAYPLVTKPAKRRVRNISKKRKC